MRIQNWRMCWIYMIVMLDLQVEYGRPEFTVGVHSVLFVNGIFAHYNFMNTGEELFRPLLGVRGQTESSLNGGFFDIADI